MPAEYAGLEDADEFGKKYTVLVYECRFTLVDENGCDKVDEDGRIIVYDAPKLDWSHIAEYVDIEDLVPTTTVEEAEQDKKARLFFDDVSQGIVELRSAIASEASVSDKALAWDTLVAELTPAVDAEDTEQDYEDRERMDRIMKDTREQI
jgi:hypothetical protein